jgi:hypothetical protein
MSSRRRIRCGLDWASDRARDAAQWPAALVRELPDRARRLPAAIEAGGRAAQTGALAAYLWDLAGGPELFSLLWRAATHTSRLTEEELARAAAVLGAEAIRFRDVRVAEGGLLNLIFPRNGARGFVTYHTVNLPTEGGRLRSEPGLLVHELVHVLQHEKLGSVYIGQCLGAQRREGYDYGGPAGLQTARAEGKSYRSFNREQQAQIAEDYFNRLQRGQDVAAYEPYIEELRRGEI